MNLICQICGFTGYSLGALAHRDLPSCTRRLTHVLIQPKSPKPWLSVKMVFFEVWK